MKLLHLSDLHIGKRLSEFSLLEDQRYILNKIYELAVSESVDAVLLSGDLYDKPIPPAEAVSLLDTFFTELSPIPVFAISGNHDSPQRLNFASRLLDRTGLHLTALYQPAQPPHILYDRCGPVNLYLLPYLKPALIRHVCPEAEVTTYAEAVAWAVNQWTLDPTQRNVLLSHQFVTGGTTCESEELSVGGLDQVPAEIFHGFDYVALGHLHGPQSITCDTIRYCGTPLKYSFSEAGHTKSATIVELEEKGCVTVRTYPLIPLRDLREIRGTYEEVTAKSFYRGTNREDYLHITLTDPEDIPEALARLRAVYPNVMKLTYDNLRTRTQRTITGADSAESKSPLDHVRDFYELQNNQPMTPDQESILRSLMGTIWEDTL